MTRDRVLITRHRRLSRRQRLGQVALDELEDEVQVTVIAAGFDRSDAGLSRSSRGDGRADTRGEPRGSRIKELFGTGEDPLRDSSDGFDVPDFLK
jgi:cell division GTPase FtsZ